MPRPQHSLLPPVGDVLHDLAEREGLGVEVRVPAARGFEAGKFGLKRGNMARLEVDRKYP